MNGQDAGMQVVYMEVEGIKIAVQLAKDAARLAWQLGKFLLLAARDAPYKKTAGKTNIKNLKARAGDGALIAATLSWDTFQKFEKEAAKCGILFSVFEPLGSGKKGSVQIILCEKDVPMFQSLLQRYKEEEIKKTVKNGRDKEKAANDFDENNRTESMSEFAENVGATTEEAVFDADMKERFGEDYKAQIIDITTHLKDNDPKVQTAGANGDKVKALAEVIQFEERAEKLRKEAPVQFQFTYDPQNGKSQIVEETKTHIRIAGKGVGVQDKNQWGSIWLPKSAILPPLNTETADGTYTARLAEDAAVVTEDPTGKEKPQQVKAKDVLYQVDWKTGEYTKTADGSQAAQPEQIAQTYDITIGKTYAGNMPDMAERNAEPMIWDENAHAIKTRIPGTYGEKVKFLWINKDKMTDTPNGKAILTDLEKNRKYNVYDVDNHVVGKMTGEELFRAHYDRVNKGVRQKAQKAAMR